MYFQRLEHFDIETIRDRYYWHITHLVLFAALTFVFSVTELTFEPAPMRAVASAPVEPVVEGPNEVLHPIVKAVQAFEPGLAMQNYKLIEGAGQIEIHFGTVALFEPGKADFLKVAGEEVRRLGRTFVGFKDKVRVRIEGHTDDVPVVANAWKYPTNWELSSARASRIARALQDVGFSREQIEVVGRADSAPLMPNRTPAGEPVPENQIANRRIVIILK